MGYQSISQLIKEIQMFNAINIVILFCSFIFGVMGTALHISLWLGMALSALVSVLYVNYERKKQRAY